MLATLLLGWSYLSYYSYSCRSLGRDRHCAGRMATAAAAEATATAAQQIPRVPGTGWASGGPACGLGTRLYNLRASFAVAEPCMPGCTLPCHTPHIHTSTSPPGLTQTQISCTHTHPHIHITPGPHTDPDIMHTHFSLCSATTFHNTIPGPAACMGPRYVMCRWSCGCRIKVGCGMW